MKKVFKHEDYFNSEGIKIPSVTTILKILNKPQLIQWANFLGKLKKNVEDVTYKAATIGTITHYILERYGKNKITNLSFLYNEYDDAIIKSVNKTLKGFIKWNKEYKPKFLMCEIKLNNENFGGTIDNVCEINGEKYIIDYKTSKTVYPSMFLQLAAYNKLLREEKNIKIDKVAILILNKNKIEYKFYKMNVEYLEKFYEPVFIKLYELYTSWNENLKIDWNTSI